MKVNAGYLLPIFSYGVLRKLPMIWNARIERFDENEKKYVLSPLLLTDKVLIVASGMVFSPLFILNWLYNDMRAFEIRCRGHDSSSYGIAPPRQLMEYILD
jgi:hypothetical protein